MKILIIEDEVLTANDLADMLVQLPGQIEINKILPSVAEAVRFLRDNEPPDLIFSDIQLGDGLSFEIFHQVKTECPVIFCTAYDEFALEEALRIREAFPGARIDAISVGPERAARTVERALAMGADEGIHILLGDDRYRVLMFGTKEFDELKGRIGDLARWARVLPALPH